MTFKERDMAGPKHILAIDQGTTSTRAIVFAADAQPVDIPAPPTGA